MPNILQNTLRRVQYLCAKILQLSGRIFIKEHSPLKDISDAQARDIGLETSELERLRFKFPSRSQNHPRL